MIIEEIEENTKHVSVTYFSLSPLLLHLTPDGTLTEAMAAVMAVEKPQRGNKRADQGVVKQRGTT